MLKKIITSPVFKYSIIFLLLLFVSTFITVFGNDEVWNYGFIKNVHDCLIPYKDSLYIIDESDLITKGQYDQKVLKYIVDNAKKIDTVGEYSVYSFEVVD